jgi:hypothetical protein
MPLGLNLKRFAAERRLSFMVAFWLLDRRAADLSDTGFDRQSVCCCEA